MEYRIQLLPYRFKILGLLLILIGAVFAYLYFYGGKPDFFKTNVFAVASFYMKKRYFTVIQTNLLDELASILFIVGIACITFSKEKVELNFYNQLRIKAIIKSLFFTTAIWIFLILVIYGAAIFIFSSLIFLLFLFGCYIIFKYELYKAKKQKVVSKNIEN